MDASFSMGCQPTAGKGSISHHDTESARLKLENRGAKVQILIRACVCLHESVCVCVCMFVVYVFVLCVCLSVYWVYDCVCVCKALPNHLLCVSHRLLV